MNLPGFEKYVAREGELLAKIPFRPLVSAALSKYDHGRAVTQAEGLVLWMAIQLRKPLAVIALTYWFNPQVRDPAEPRIVCLRKFLEENIAAVNARLASVGVRLAFESSEKGYLRDAGGRCDGWGELVGCTAFTCWVLRTTTLPADALSLSKMKVPLMSLCSGSQVGTNLAAV